LGILFKPGHEKLRDKLIGGSLHLSQVNKEQGTVFRIQEYLSASQHKLYKDAWEEAGQRSRSGKGEEWTVVGPKSKPSLLPKKRLEEGNRVSKEERKEAEQDKFNNISKRFCRMAWFRGWWKGYTRFRMLRRLSKRNVMPSEIEEEVVMCSFCPRI
jgi:hypothetical protein